MYNWLKMNIQRIEYEAQQIEIVTRLTNMNSRHD